MKNKILSEIIKDAKKLISFKTIKDNFQEFEKALDYVKKELNDYFIREIDIDGYKNLVISNTQDMALDIIFCAHIDVVPADKYEAVEKKGKLYGRGSFDMKSQLAVIMSLLKNNRSDKNIAFIITSDEEIGGNCCKQIMNEYNAKLAVIPDAGKNFQLVVEEKGLLQVELKLNGITSHASEPYKGVNPILGLMELYYDLLEKYKMPKDENDFITSINLSKISGGDANNMVPSVASMVLDIRFTKDITVDKLIKDIKNVNSNVQVNILDQGPVFQVDSELPIIKKFISDASLVLGRDVEIKKCVATSDAIYFSEKNIPTIMMNPVGDYWHGPNEYVELDSLYKLYEIFKSLL